MHLNHEHELFHLLKSKIENKLWKQIFWEEALMILFLYIYFALSSQKSQTIR